MRCRVRTGEARARTTAEPAECVTRPPFKRAPHAATARCLRRRFVHCAQRQDVPKSRQRDTTEPWERPRGECAQRGPKGETPLERGESTRFRRPGPGADARPPPAPAAGMSPADQAFLRQDTLPPAKRRPNSNI